MMIIIMIVTGITIPIHTHNPRTCAIYLLLLSPSQIHVEELVENVLVKRSKFFLVQVQPFVNVDLVEDVAHGSNASLAEELGHHRPHFHHRLI